MLKWLMRKGIAAFEREVETTTPATCARSSTPTRGRPGSSDAGGGDRLVSEGRAAGGAGRRRRITAVRHEDCGPCTQLGVSMAETLGRADPKVLRAILTEDAGGDARRRGARRGGSRARRWTTIRSCRRVSRGDRAGAGGRARLISLAFAMVASRTYPTVKYAHGPRPGLLRGSSSPARRPRAQPARRRRTRRDG